MIKKRIILALTFKDGVLFRTKKFKPDYRYTKNFIDLWSADEMILIDISENKQKKNFIDIVKFFSNNCHLPISVGGGIKNISQVKKLFKLGADKIILNSSSFYDWDIIKKVSQIYGSQSIIHSVDCKLIKSKKFKVAINNGTKIVSYNPIEWVKKAISYGCGEILINDIDYDGSLIGYNIPLIKNITSKIKKPCLALGGAGSWNHIYELFKKTNVSGACTQNIYHFTNESINSLKNFLKSKKIPIRHTNDNYTL